METRIVRRLTSGVSAAVLSARVGTEPVAPPAQVRFSIASVFVGADTFRVHLPPDHTESIPFALSAGRHVFGARTFGSFVCSWPDTVVTATPGATVTVMLPFYCS